MLKREERRKKKEERREKRKNKMLIAIDPGHGGTDNGAVYGFTEEDDTNLGIGFYLDYELRLNNINTYMTREKDENVSLSQRTTEANNRQVDLFISIHCDAFHKVTASGMSVHNYQYSGITALNIASKIDRQLRTYFPQHRQRGIKKSNFHVLRETQMAAVLIECEFLSNTKTCKFLKEPENQRRLAKAITSGVVTFKSGRRG